MRIRFRPIEFILSMIFWIPGVILLVWQLGWLATIGVILVAYSFSVRTSE